MRTYTETTDDVTITALPLYLDGQSDPLTHKYVFAYFIRIQNNRSEAVRLLRRHWIITDGDGDVKHVEGEGVVGKQPLIQPGKAHEYNSYCILENLEGHMEGSYLMQRPNGDLFSVVIPRFTLRAAAN